MCFFFSSRRRHTRFDCDWSSDVCSSDLERFSKALRSEVVHRKANDRKLLRKERSEEHTSELQSQSNLVCRLLLEKKKRSATAAKLTIDQAYVLITPPQLSSSLETSDGRC